MSIHVTVAARGVAELSPTPTPFRMASVASAPVMEEQKAYKMEMRNKVKWAKMCTWTSYLNRIPKLVG